MFPLWFVNEAVKKNITKAITIQPQNEKKTVAAN